MHISSQIKEQAALVSITTSEKEGKDQSFTFGKSGDTDDQAREGASGAAHRHRRRRRSRRHGFRKTTASNRRSTGGKPHYQPRTASGINHLHIPTGHPTTNLNPLLLQSSITRAYYLYKTVEQNKIQKFKKQKKNPTNYSFFFLRFDSKTGQESHQKKNKNHIFTDAYTEQQQQLFPRFHQPKAQTFDKKPSKKKSI